MGLRTWVKERLFGKPKLIVTLTTEPPVNPIASPQSIAPVVLPKPIVPALVEPLDNSIIEATEVSQYPSWEENFESVLGDREWSTLIGFSSEERLERIKKLKFLSAYAPTDDQKADIWRQIGRFHHAEGDVKNSHDLHKKALKAYEEAIEIKSNFHGAWASRGSALSSLNRKEEAIASYDKAIKIKPDFYEVWCNRGYLLNRLGRYEEAIISCEKAIEIKPDFYYAWFNRGVSLDLLKLIEEAIVSYEKAIEIKPDYPEAWFKRGNSLYELGRIEEAIASYEKTLEIKSDYSEAWHNRGVLLCELGRTEEAIVSCDKAIEIKPDDPEIWYSRGNSLASLGRMEEAIESWETAIEIKSDYPEAWSNRGNSLHELGRNEEAIVSCKTAVEIKSDYSEAWHNCGASLHALSRYEEAIESYDKAIEFKPDLYQAWANRGLAAASSRSSSPYALPIILNQRPANLHHKHPELKARGYDGQVASLTVGLTYCHADTHPFSHGYLQRELGNAHFDAKQWGKAFKAYQSALTVLIETDFPEERLLTLQQIIRLTLTQNNLPTARHYQLEGSKLYETLRTQAKDQRAFDAKFRTFRLTEIDLLIGENEPRRALEQAEFYKNRALTWLLDPPNPLNKGEQEPEPDSATFSTEADQLKVPLIKGDLGGSIVYWHQSTDRITTFILTNDNAEPIVLDCDRQQQHNRFTAWKDKWDKDYDDYRSKKSATQSDHPWRQQMRDRLATLRDILAIDQILTHLPIDHSLILIPHRDLHRYPIHALFDRPAVHSPSIQSIQSIVRAAHPAPSSSLLTIADPETDQPAMPYARLESALLQSIVRASHPAPLLSALSPEASNLPNILQSLQSPHHHFHFTGHGIHNPTHPNRSALQLTDSLLTANTISQLRLHHQHLAILAACETAIVTPDDTSDYIGIQSAFLRAGTRTILSTLWTIDEIASTWFIVHFYQQILNGTKPSTALITTQTWMQTLTWQQLAHWLTELRQLPALPSDPYDRLTARISNILEKHDTINELTDYHHPYYWSAFVLTGEG